MKNRLQFNRHYALFNTREEALNALRARITDPGFIPLIGEPMVFRYEDENHNIQVILAIGKKAGNNLDERDYHVIDTADLDEKIAAEVSAREALDDETIKRIIFDGVESEFADNVATLSVSANSIPIGPYEEYDGRANTPHPIHDDYSLLEAVKQVDTNFINFLDDTDAKVNGLHIVKVTSGLDANVREAYDLVNLSGNVQANSERILIYKDSSLYNVYLGHTDDRLDDYSSPVVTPGTGDTALCFIYIKADGTYQLIAINVEEFLQENEFEDGLVVDNHVVKVKIDMTSEPFLTVSADGVKLAGVQTAIDYAQQAEEDRAISAETAIQAELDATQMGAGLDTDGSYIHDHSANYIDEATSLANADHLIDSALKDESDRATTAEGTLDQKIDDEATRAVGAEAGLQDAITAEETRATAAEEALQSNIDDEATRATVAEAGLQNNIDAEVSARISADEAIQNELDATQVGAGLASDGSYVHDHQTTYIDEATSLANADHLLDTALKDESDRAIAAEASLSAETVNETARAIAAESALQNAIDAEQTRAQGAESTLQDNIDAEVTRAQGVETSLASMISELSAGTESGISELDNKIDTEINGLSAATVGEVGRLDNEIDSEEQRAAAAEGAIDDKVDELSGVTAAFSSATVSEIARIDAASTRNKVKSAGHTIVVTEAAEGTNLEANIDGKTILSNSGELKTGLKVAALAHGELEANVREAFRLVDNEGTPVDTTIVKIYKSSSLQNIELYKDLSTGIDYVRITYTNNSGETQQFDLDIQQLIFEAEFKDGLVVNSDGEVRVKIDPTSDAFLSVSSEGVKLSGVESALQSISSVTDNIISACGLNIGSQGGYVPHTNTPIISGASSLDQADVLLDNAICAISGAVWTLSGNAGDVAELEEKVRDLSAVTRSFSSNTVAEIESLKAAISGNTGVTVLSAATVNLSATTVDIDDRLTAVEAAIIENSGVTQLSAATINLSSATVYIEEHIAGEYIILGSYEVASGAGEDLVIESSDTVSEAFGKIQKQILDDEEANAAAFNDLNNRIASAETAISANTGVTILSAATVSEFNTVFNEINNLSGDLITLSSVTVNEITNIHNDISNVSGDVISLSSATVTINNNVSNLSAATTSISGDLNTLSSVTVSLNTNITNLSAATTSISGDLNTLSSATVSLSGDVTNLSAATTSISGDLNTLSSVTVDINTNVSNLSAATVNISGDVISLSSATVSLGSDVTNLSAATIDLSGAVMSISAKTSGVLTVSLNNTEQGKYSPSANTTIDIEVTGADILLTGYEIATGTSLEDLVVEDDDTVNEAFGKIQKQIYDNELVIAGAFNDINDRVRELSGNSMNPSDYYTKEDVDEMLPKKEFSTASSVTNLTFGKYLTVVTISGTSATTLSIIQNSAIWGLADGEVMEAHVIVKNDDSSLGLTVTLPTEQTDSRVRITGGNELLVDPNGFGEVNAIITRNGNDYTIYLITSF